MFVGIFPSGCTIFNIVWCLLWPNSRCIHNNIHGTSPNHYLQPTVPERHHISYFYKSRTFIVPPRTSRLLPLLYIYFSYPQAFVTLEEFTISGNIERKVFLCRVGWATRLHTHSCTRRELSSTLHTLRCFYSWQNGVCVCVLAGMENTVHTRSETCDCVFVCIEG